MTELLTVENAQILTPREQDILVNALRLAADEWDALAKEAGAGATRLTDRLTGLARKARELALNASAAEHVIFDQGIEVSNGEQREE